MPATEPDDLARPDVYVVVRILERLWIKGPDHPRTRLQHAARLNTRVFTKYMAWLEAKGYVARALVAGTESFSITKRGVDVLRSLATWIDETMGPPERRRRI